MNKSEIIEGDKLIAEFMGEKATGGYHQSWDWLMPVVEKIEENCPEKPDWTDGNTGWPCTLFSATCSPWKIENTYKSVIKYIKWYNTQNQ